MCSWKTQEHDTALSHVKGNMLSLKHTTVTINFVFSLLMQSEFILFVDVTTKYLWHYRDTFSSPSPFIFCCCIIRQSWCFTLFSHSVITWSIIYCPYGVKTRRQSECCLHWLQNNMRGWNKYFLLFLEQSVCLDEAGRCFNTMWKLLLRKLQAWHQDKRYWNFLQQQHFLVKI